MPKDNSSWFATGLRFLTRLVTLGSVFIPSSLSNENNNSALSLKNTNQTADIILPPGTYGDLRQHLVETVEDPLVTAEPKLTLLQQAENLYNFALTEESEQNLLNWISSNNTLTPQFLKELIAQEDNNPKNTKLINWLLERKIRLSLHFELKSNSALVFAKQLYQRDNSNEYAINLLIKEELQNNPVQKKLLAKAFNHKDLFYRYSLQLQKSNSLQHYLSHLYLATFNQIMMAHPGNQDWRYYLMEGINSYANAINLAKKDIPKVTQYYTLKEQEEFIYDYSAVKQAKLQQIKLHLKEMRSGLAKHIKLLEGEEYKELPELIENILEIDPEFEPYLDAKKIQLELRQNFTL